jgi:hypothetical protein
MGDRRGRLCPQAAVVHRVTGPAVGPPDRGGYAPGAGSDPSGSPRERHQRRRGRGQGARPPPRPGPGRRPRCRPAPGRRGHLGVRRAQRRGHSAAAGGRPAGGPARVRRGGRVRAAAEVPRRPHGRGDLDQVATHTHVAVSPTAAASGPQGSPRSSPPVVSSPIRSATMAACTRPLTPSLRKMWLTWTLAVFGLM